MSTILPTRVSLYDLLILDTQPIDSILADSGRISLVQARLLRQHGLQAILSALLAYEQINGAQKVEKKLLCRSQVKELRKYNAFNFKTMAAAVLHGKASAIVLFRHQKILDSVCESLSLIADTSKPKTMIILESLSLIALREIAIIADFSYLDAKELSLWCSYQPQFMQLDRSALLATQRHPTDAKHDGECLIDKQPTISVLDNYDMSWHELTGYKPPVRQSNTRQNNPTDHAEDIPHYAKITGRKPTLASIPKDNSLNNDLNDDSNNNLDNPLVKSEQEAILVFSRLENITLPHHRWLLQLGKIADIYLSRRRLKIAPEPKQPPQRPLIDLGLLANHSKTPITVSEQPIEYDKPVPFWKNRTILLILAIVASLSILSFIKFKHNETSPYDSTPLDTHSQDQSKPYHDIAIVRVKDDGSDKPNSKDTATDSTASMNSNANLTNDVANTKDSIVEPNTTTLTTNITSHIAAANPTISNSLATKSQPLELKDNKQHDTINNTNEVSSNPTAITTVTDTPVKDANQSGILSSHDTPSVVSPKEHANVQAPNVADNRELKIKNVTTDDAMTDAAITTSPKTDKAESATEETMQNNSNTMPPKNTELNAK